MQSVDLTIQESDYHDLRRLLARKNGIEAVAYVLCGQSRIRCDPWGEQSRYRFALHTIIPIPPEDVRSADGHHVTWAGESYVKLLKRAENEKLVPGVVHTHPSGLENFSDQDDKNEKELIRSAHNRNGKGEKLISILLAGEDKVRARLWLDPCGPIDADIVRVVGRRLRIHSLREASADIDFLARQALAFGAHLGSLLKSMRIGIVGCGGTGSATAMLLARLGVGQLVLFDNDVIEVPNLNRLHGARRTDVGSPKVDVLAREITDFGLDVQIIPLQGWVGDSRFRDALKACDVIFGCTDDHAGRFLLNRLAYYYLIPVIDMGLRINPQNDGNSSGDITGRITILFPGAPCLVCRDIIDHNIAKRQDMQRHSPQKFAQRKAEAYVRGGDDPAPAVVTFTTETACLAVNELLEAIIDFRSSGGWVWRRDRRFDISPGDITDSSLGAKSKPGCRVCSLKDDWGRCDTDQFLGRIG